MWQYDAYGNLLNDGTSTYTYDAANRLISVTDAASTTTYAYNGDGDRVSQDVDGTLTTYTLDTATPLTRLLAETTGPDTTFTLHGLDLVAQSDGTATEYFSTDGLGSVRQLTDSTGSVLLNQTFDPYGNPYVHTGAGDTRFGFTGEQVDGNGLVYLRARYYQPEMGRFLSADPSRQERNPYQYTMSNPVLHTDPSGLTVDCGWWESGCESNSQPGGRVNDDHRNLTFWLVEAMKTNAQSPEVAEIRELNSRAATALILLPVVFLFDDCLTVEYAKAYSNLKAEAYDKFRSLVRAGARWDFKLPIQDKLGKSVRLCDSLKCRWYNYDVIANIHFGYIGNAAGFDPVELHVGAGEAQLGDNPNTPPVEVIDNCLIANCDDPLDYNAVEMGIELYNSARPTQLTIPKFRSKLLRYASSLRRESPPDTPYFQQIYPVDPKFGPEYPVDYFNGDRR